MPIRHYIELLVQYRRLVLAVTLGVGLVSAAFSLLLLLIGPQYRATAGVTVLPTQAELSFSQRFQQGGSNPAGLMMQTHIEYLLSRPVAELTLDKLVEQSAAESGDQGEPPPEPNWIARVVGRGMHALRVAYHFINYGEHIDPAPYDEAVTEIQQSVSVRMIEGSFILQITAAAADPAAAALIANTLADAYVARIHQTVDAAADKLTGHLKQELGRRQSQMDPQEAAALRNRLLDVELSRAAAIGQVRVIDPAQPPLYPAFPKLLPNTAAGLVAGALGAVLVVIMLDTFGTTARTTADMRRLVGEQFLGGVPRRLAALLRAGARRLPLAGGESFAAAAGPRIALLGATGQGWVHVVGVGGETAASQGALAIAATYAGADLVVLVDLGGRGRHLVRRQGEELRLDPVDGDGPQRGVVVVTTGVLRPTGSRLLAHQGTAAPSAADLSEPLLVYAVAAGRATEDFIGALAWAPRPASSSRPLFVLVS